jgi:hypothetical protein
MPTLSKSERIAQAIIALLTVPPLSGVPAGDVLRDPLDALDSADYPLLCVELGDEAAPTRPVTGAKQRSVMVRVSVLARGATPLLAADPIATEAAARLLAAPELGGLAIDTEEGPTERLTDELGEGSARITMHWQVIYRTPETSKE